MQPQIGAANITPQIVGSAPMRAANVQAQDAKAWMLPEAKTDDLLYISTTQKTFVDAYPEGKRVGQLSVGGFYLCAGNDGNVFLSQYTEGSYGILEYAHGATTPIQTIKTAGPPWGCSVDPVSGDLAVAIPDVKGLYHGELAIYKHARGKPHLIPDYPTIVYPFFCHYDASGNLFFDGTPGNNSPYFAEIPRGSNTVTNITVANGFFYADDDIQWDGSYIAVADDFAQAVYQLSVSGSSATIVGTVRLQHWNGPAAREVWIGKDRLISSPGRHDAAAVWHYPMGGLFFKRLHPDLDDQEVEGVVVSFAKRARSLPISARRRP